MISHEYKCIFIHIMHCGGNHMEAWIQGKDQWEIRHNFKHVTARKAKMEYHQYWDDYFKFAFVRNPYDRIVTELNSNTAGMLHWYMRRNDNIEEKLLNIDVHRYYDVHCNGGAFINDSNEWNDPEFESNSVYKNITFGLDKVYKYEDWDNACLEIAEIIKIDKEYIKLPSESEIGYALDRKYHVEDLKQLDIELINTMHLKDFEHYGYEMTPSNILW